MEEKFNQLKQHLAEVADLQYTGALLGWDLRLTCRPEARSAAVTR